MHAVNNVQIRKIAMSKLCFHQSAGNDADHRAAKRPRGICNSAHEPNPTSAVDNSDTSFSEDPASPTGRIEKGFITPRM